MQRGGHYSIRATMGCRTRACSMSPRRSTPSRGCCSIPTLFPADGTVALTGYELSDDGKLLAYGLAEKGSRLATVESPRRGTGEDLKIDLRGSSSRASPGPTTAAASITAATTSPTKETELTGTNYYQKLYFHQLRQAAIRRQADLRAERRKGMGIWRRSDRRRPVPGRRAYGAAPSARTRSSISI